MKPNYRRRVLLVAAAAAGVVPFVSIVRAQADERVIKVVAKRFDYTPGEIQLKKGLPVVLEFTSLDVPMGFSAPDFGVRTDILPGTTSKVRFTPDKVGTFTFHCDIFCGSGHEEMAGSIIVT
jgi:cytochrome c oxidase subunit 2